MRQVQAGDGSEDDIATEEHDLVDANDLALWEGLEVGRPVGFHSIDPEHVHLLQLISDGSNAFGDVWEATCHMKRVAVKIPKAHKSENSIQEWLKEIEIMANNWHPNILLYMGTCVKDEKLMIVMELLDTDLHKLLHCSDEPLSLYIRMKMCKDVALGMNWLHKTEPTIIHRDLKTSNLLVEKIGHEYKVKVADFGVSVIKRDTPGPLKQEPIASSCFLGSILTTAPEILEGVGNFNEKTDIYSFGLVLWEVATRKKLFPELVEKGSFSHFVNVVCREKRRPPIDSHMPAHLRVLIERCWHHDPFRRPDFDEIITDLNEIIVKSAIRDPHGTNFWIKNFGHEEKVPWDKFATQFYSFMRMPLPIDPDPSFTGKPSYVYLGVNEDELSNEGLNFVDGTDGNDGSLYELKDEKIEPDMLLSEEAWEDIFKMRCLKTLLDNYMAERYRSDNSPSDYVSIERFGQVLDWFGPIKYKRRGSPACSLLDDIRNVLEKKWFHGDISAETAQTLLAKRPGYFLVRFSSNDKYPGCFTVSRVSGSGSGATYHIRISHTEHGFSINEKCFPTLVELISALGPSLHLYTPCEVPSRYQAIFNTRISSGKGDRTVRLE